MVGRVLAALRQRLGWTQAHLSEVAALAPSALSRIECGKAQPDTPTLCRLTDLLGLPCALVLDIIEEVYQLAETTLRKEVRTTGNPWSRAPVVLGEEKLAELISTVVDTTLSSKPW